MSKYDNVILMIGEFEELPYFVQVLIRVYEFRFCDYLDAQHKCHCHEFRYILVSITRMKTERKYFIGDQVWAGTPMYCFMDK